MIRKLAVMTVFSIKLLWLIPVSAAPDSAPGGGVEERKSPGSIGSVTEASGTKQSPKRLSDYQPNEEVRVIIHFKDKPALSVFEGDRMQGASRKTKVSAVSDARRRIEAKQTQIINDLKQKKLITASSRRFSRVANGVSAQIRAADFQKIVSSPDVLSVTLDQRVKALGDVSVQQVGAPEVWAMQDAKNQAVTGVGITIAIIDTGIDYTHPDLGGCLGPSCKVIGGYDFVNNDTDPMDDHFHGTAVAGVAAASGTITGVAPDAKLLAYKALDADGWGYESDIIAAIERATDPDGDPQTDDAVDVMNLSLGTSWSGSTSSVSRAADIAMRAGVIVVVAAGNEGDYGLNTITAPGSANDVITVGAVDVNGDVPSWSSRGLFAYDADMGVTSVKPEIAAPGVNVETTDLDGTYGFYAGTSVAAPHVAGAAALLRQLYPELSSAEIKALLVNHAAAANGPVEAVGNGQLQVTSAANAAYLVSPPTLYLGYAGQVTGSVKDRSLTLRSLSGEREFSISEQGSFPAGVTIEHAPGNVFVAEGEESVSVQTVTINLDQVAIPAELEQPYSSDLLVSAGGESVSVPIAFHRAEMLKIQEKVTPWVGYYWNYWGKFFDSSHEYNAYIDSYQSEEAALYVPVRDEPVTGLFMEWNHPSDNVFALEGVRAELGPVVVDPETNMYTINRPMDHEGKPLDFKEQMMRVSHVDRPEVVLWPHGVWGTNRPMVNLSGFSDNFRVQYLGLFKEPERSPADQKMYVLKSDTAGVLQHLDFTVSPTPGVELLINLPELTGQEYDLINWVFAYEENGWITGAGTPERHAGPIRITLNGNESDFLSSTIFPSFDVRTPDFYNRAMTSEFSLSSERYRKLRRSDSDQNRVSEILERPHGLIPLGSGVRYWAALLRNENGALYLKPDWNRYPLLAVRDSWGNHFQNDINYIASCVDTGQTYSSGPLSGSNPVLYSSAGCAELAIQYDYPTFLLGEEYRSQVDLTLANLDSMQTPRIKVLELREAGAVVSYAQASAELGFLAESSMPLEVVSAEIGLEDGSWEPLALEASGNYYIANLPDFSTATKANLRISLADSSGNSMVNTINGAFMLGSGSAELMDLDGDGASDAIDVFPTNPTEIRDFDGDGVGDNSDPDDDNDGVEDSEDLFPLDPSESADSDSDGIGNNADPDDDNDGVDDANDDLPFDPDETVDTDGDGIGNNADTDDDGDGVADEEDSKPLDPNYWDTLDASVTATSLSLEQSSATKGDQDVVLQVFQLTTNLQTTLGSITFKASGTGDESVRVERVRWYLNVNRDGSVDSGDLLLGEGNYDMDDGRLVLNITGDPLELSAGEHEFIIAYDLAQ
ncbi:Serine protease AprX [Microbulbifer aggregans]|uniref:Serine protease AprX n=1 Tax=Microbulbifer aggregans TaxID=1769779 RepID=A0A1C9W4J3_9GAMM|nr:S8 family serine peptidase [Microbulbifer aggregans]AOS96065.1 Serine protease AprX [Microbulbifer aggregans]